jgi:hypothetical protein
MPVKTPFGEMIHCLKCGEYYEQIMLFDEERKKQHEEEKRSL